MKQTKLDNYFNIKLKKDPKTPNNTPIYGPTNNPINNISFNNFKLYDTLPKYVLRFDGASKGNPGISGAGAVLYYNNEEIWHGTIYLGKQTNNYAEYYGMIIGLQEAKKKGISNLYIEGDSKLVINQMKGIYNVKSSNLLDLYKKAKLLVLSFDTIDYKHIYRDQNKRADELANIAVK